MPRNKEFELVQDLIIKAHNPNVKATFRADIAEGDTPEEWNNNAERALKSLMLVKDTDNADTTIIKLLLSLMYRLDKIENETANDTIYFQPWADREQRPMVQIQFIENAAPSGRSRYVHEFSFRLKGKETSDITGTVLDELRREIRAQFPPTYRFRPGKRKCTYYNPVDGFRSIIFAETDNGAKELARKLNNINDTTYDEENFSAKGLVSAQQVKQKKVRYRNELVDVPTRKYATVDCIPYRAYFYPGSGLKTELLVVF
jgi:hypothetical protein